MEATSMVVWEMIALQSSIWSFKRSKGRKSFAGICVRSIGGGDAPRIGSGSFDRLAGGSVTSTFLSMGWSLGRIWATGTHVCEQRSDSMQNRWLGVSVPDVVLEFRALRRDGVLSTGGGHLFASCDVPWQKGSGCCVSQALLQVI